MTELVLVVVVVALLVERAVQQRGVAAERARLLNAIVARTSSEFVALERTPTAKPKADDDEDRPRGPRLPVGLD